MHDADKPRFLPGQLIEVAAYDGKPRADLGEVYKASWSYDREDWLLAVRLFSAEGEAPRFRNFYQGRLTAE